MVEISCFKDHEHTHPTYTFVFKNLALIQSEGQVPLISDFPSLTTKHGITILQYFVHDYSTCSSVHPSVLVQYGYLYKHYNNKSASKLI